MNAVVTDEEHVRTVGAHSALRLVALGTEHNIPFHAPNLHLTVLALERLDPAIRQAFFKLRLPAVVARIDRHQRPSPMSTVRPNVTELDAMSDVSSTSTGLAAFGII